MPAPVHLEDVNLLGLDTKTSPFLVPPGGLLQAQNVVMPQQGRWQKRFGIQNLPTLPGGYLDWCATYNTNELLVSSVSTTPGTIGLETQQAWQPNTQTWLQKGDLPTVSVDTAIRVASSSNLQAADAAVSNGFACYAYQTVPQTGISNVRFSVLNQATGEPVMLDQQVPTGVQTFDPRVVAIGPYFVLLFRLGQVGSSVGLWSVTIDPVQHTVSSPFNLNTVPLSVNGYDAVAVSGSTSGHNGQYVAITYLSAVSGYTVGFNPWTNSICISTTAILGANGTFVGIVKFPNNLCVFYCDTYPSVSMFWTDLNLAGATSVTTISSSVPLGKATVIPSSAGWTLIYETLATQDTNTGRFETMPALLFASGPVASAQSVGPSGLFRDCSLAANAFTLPFQSQFFVPIIYQGNFGAARYAAQSTLQQTYMLLESNPNNAGQAEPATIAARFATATGGGPTLWLKCPQVNVSAAQEVGATATWACGIQQAGSGNFDGTYQVTQSVASAVATFYPEKYDATLGSDLHIAGGGFLQMYDGNAFVEHNFHVAPEPPVAWLCNVACCRLVVGLAGSGTGATAEQNAIYFPPDAPDPTGTIYGSGWQIKPSSYVTVPLQQVPSAHAATASATLPMFSVVGAGQEIQIGGIVFTAVSSGALYNGLSVSITANEFNTVFPDTTQLRAVGVGTFPNLSITFILPQDGLSLPNLASAINSVVLNGTSTPVSDYLDASWFTTSINTNFYGNPQTLPAGPYPDPSTAQFTGGVDIGAGIAGQGLGGYVYFVVDGIGSDPLPAATQISANIPCFINSTDSAQQVAQKFFAAVTNSGSMSAIVTASPPVGGSAPPTSAAGLPTWHVLLTCTLGTSSSGPGSPCVYSEDFRGDFIDTNTSQITCPAGYRIAPGGYFCLPTLSSCICFYFQVDGVGVVPQASAVTALPPPSGVQANVPVILVPSNTNPIHSYSTPTQVATAVAAAISANLPAGWAPTITQNGCIITLSSTGGTPAPYNVSVCGSVYDGFYEEGVVWEWTDGAGQLHQSETSLPVSFNIQGSAPTVDPNGKLYSVTGSLLAVNTLGGMLLNGVAVGGNGPRLILPALWATSKSNVSAAFYRSTASAGQNPTLYRTSNPLSPVTNPTNVTSTVTDPFSGNSVPPDMLTYLDSVTDSQINANAAVYTTGGVLDNYPAPGGTHVHAHRGRLFVANGQQLSYSQPWQPEQQLAVEFAADLVIDIVDGSVGNIVATATLDDKLLILCEQGLYYIYGDGPSSTGQGDFSPPQRIMADTGCVAAGSVIETPEGVWFQSPKGIYFIDRNLQLTFRGQQVSGLTAGKICNAAVLMQDRTEIRFFMSSKAGQAVPTTDYVLCYNYLYNVWSQFTKWAGNSACLWNNSLVFVDSLGNVQQEQTNSYLDNGAFTQSLLQTGWLGKSNGLQGWLRVDKAALLGAFGSSHNVQVNVAFDYEPSFTQVLYEASEIVNQQNYAAANVLPAFGANTPYGITDGSAWNFRLFVPPSPRGGRVSAVSFTISDVQDSLPGSGFALDALTLEIQSFGKLNRFGTSRSTG